MIPAAVYARVSSEMQAAAETPITGQLQEIRRYALANGYEIVREYVDEGVSGTTE
jgi:site-specific DNA recombinase